MNKLEKDIITFFKYYINRETEDERNFKNHQKQCKLKLCITHNDCVDDNKKELLMVHTKLTQFHSDEYDTELDHFFIKFQEILHHIDSKTNNSNAILHITSIKTIITKENSKLETVFMTLVKNDHNGKKQKTQKSFTREIMCPHFINDHLKTKEPMNELENLEKSDTLKTSNPLIKNHNNNNDEKNNNDKNDNNYKIDKNDKPYKLDKLKRLFSINKKKDGSHSKVFEKKVSKLQSIKTTKQNLNLIGVFEPIPRKNSLAFPTISPPKKQSIFFLKPAFTEINEMERKKATNISAKLWMGYKNEDIQYDIHDNIKQKESNFEIDSDDYLYMDEEEEDKDVKPLRNDMKTNSTNVLCSHFDFEADNSARKRTDSLFLNEVCTCQESRLNTIAQYFIELRKTKNKVVLKSFDDFDENSGHFRFCPFSFNNTQKNYEPSDSLPRRHIRRNSLISVHSEMHLDKMIKNLNDNHQINCPYDNVRFFFDEKLTFELYKEALSKILKTDNTLEHLVLFFYFTRTVIMQIDDPSSKDNQQIVKIQEFAEKYILETYLDEIQKQGDIERFIINSEKFDEIE